MDSNLINDLRALIVKSELPIGNEITRPDGTSRFLVRDGFKVVDLEPAKAQQGVALESLESLPTWIITAQRWQDSKEGWIFWTDSGITFYPDISKYPTMAPAVFDFVLTPEARTWGGDKNFKINPSQKVFKAMIEVALALPNDLLLLHDALGWLEVATKMTMVKTVNSDSILESRQNFKIAFQSSTGPGTVEVPKDLNLEMRLFKGAPALSAIPYRVDFEWEDGSMPAFILESHLGPTLLRQMAQTAVEWVAAEVEKAGLPDYKLVVVNGTKG